MSTKIKNMTRIDRIKQKLSVLKPHICEVIDESHKHAAHTNNSLESHFTIKISKEAFGDKTLIMKHRLINNLLAEELKNGLHAFSVKII